MQRQTLRTWVSFVNRAPKIGLAILWSMLGCGFLLFAFPARSNLPYLLDGKLVQATVVTAPVIDNLGGKFGPKYVVRFEYSDAAGNIHTGTGRVRSAGKLKPGDLIAVRYVRSDPSRSRLETNVWDGMPSLLFALLGLVIVVASMMYGIGGMTRKATPNRKSNPLGPLNDGARCKVIGGTHKGKNGIVRDIHTSKTGQVTITVVQSKGERFKTLVDRGAVHRIIRPGGIRKLPSWDGGDWLWWRLWLRLMSVCSRGCPAPAVPRNRGAPSGGCSRGT